MIPANRLKLSAILFFVLLPFLGAINAANAQNETEDTTLVAAPTISTAATSPNTQALAVALDSAMDRAVYQNRVVGAVVMVAQDGKIVFQRAVGFADRDTKIPMRKDSIFRFASVTKAFTAMAAAALVDQGKLKLDDPVTKFLPDFTPKLPNGQPAVITVKQLLTHTAGLNYRFFEEKDGPYQKAGVSDGLDTSTLTLDENIQRIGSVPLLFEPGSRWHYSLAMDVLGAVVAKANGSTLPEAIKSLVTAPLGMKDTGFAVTDKYRLTTPYYHVAQVQDAAHPNPTIQPSPPPALKMQADEIVPFGGGTIHFSPGRIMDANAFPSGGAGMVGTAKEMISMLEAIRLGAPIVSPELVTMMNTNQIGTNRVQPGVGFGLGWGIILDPAEAQTPQSAGTLTWSGVYGNYWFVDPAKKLSVVILTNTAFEGMTGKIVTDVRDAVYANLPQ